MKNFQFISAQGTKIEGKFLEFPTNDDKKNQYYADFVLIHAFPFDSDMYVSNFENQNLISEFEKIAQKRGKIRVFLPDLPGFGKSETLNNQPSDLLPYVGIISDLIEEYSITNVILGGCSMGGYIILEYSARNIERVNGLILIDTRESADNEDQRENRLDTIQAIKELIKRNPKGQNKGTLLGDLYNKYSEVKEFVDGLKLKLTSDEIFENNQKGEEDLLNLMLKQTVQGVLDALSGMAGRRDTSFVLEKMKNPVLIVVGEGDKITPIETAENMKKIAKHASLKIIKSAGHLSNHDNVREFNNVLVKWTKEQL